MFAGLLPGWSDVAPVPRAALPNLFPQSSARSCGRGRRRSGGAATRFPAGPAACSNRRRCCRPRVRTSLPPRPVYCRRRCLRPLRVTRATNRDVYPPIPTPRGASDGRARLRLERVLEIRHLLDGAGSLEQHRLGEMVAHELDAHGEPLRQAAGDAYRGNAGEVHGDGAEVLIVHGERVVDLLADPKRHRRRGRADEHLVARKGLPEILYYLRAHLLGLGVVSVVVAAGESIGTEHDAPLRLVPEALFARPAVHLVDALGSRGPIAVAYPVKAGQVRGDLGGSYDVVSGQSVARVRQAYLPYLGPGAFEVPRDPLDDLAHARLDAFAHQLLYHPDPKTRDTAFELCQVIWDLDVRARRVARVVAGDGLQEKSGVAHVTGHRPDLVQGRGERDEPVARDPPIGRLKAHNAAQSGGLPHRTAGIRAQGPPTLARGDRRRRAP